MAYRRILDWQSMVRAHGLDSGSLVCRVLWYMIPCYTIPYDTILLKELRGLGRAVICISRARRARAEASYGSPLEA